MPVIDAHRGIMGGTPFDVTARSTRINGPTAPGFQPRATLSLLVDDAMLRAKLPGFDGMEKPFALVPKNGGNGVQWDKVYLQYDPTHSGSYLAGHNCDAYSTGLVGDIGLLSREGVAFGVETNVATVWLQRFRDNYPVTPV